MKNKYKKENKQISLLILSIIFILCGALIFAYPNLSNYLAEKNHAEAIRTYDEKVSSLSEEQINEELQKAQVYNENLAGDPVHDPFVAGSGYALPTNYTSVLNLSNDDVMASVEIPKIKVNLPIYHGTSEEVLTKGVGHIQSTSLPIGGVSTHSVLTGHTGLPSAELFTNIDKLNIGDIFYIHVLNQTLTYKIYETKVILPDEIDELRVTDGEDFVTLVTCTPYGINTHRLLVKARRTEYEPYVSDKEEKSENTQITEHNYFLIGVVIGIIILILILAITKRYTNMSKKEKVNKSKNV